MNGPPLLDVDDLRVEFPTPKGSVRAADGVSFRVWPGEIVGLVGESGCGKSVTTLALLRLVRPPGRIASGRIVVQGRGLLALAAQALRMPRGSAMAMTFQNPVMALVPAFRVGAPVAEVFEPHLHLTR